MSEHDSSQVALVGSGIVLLLAWNWRRRVILALAVAWCAAFVLVIPASFVAYQSGLHFAKWLPKSARARVILWEYTAEQTLHQPLLGVGVDSTSHLSKLQKETSTPEQPKDFVYPRTMGHHAHNIFLQTWSELGALGAILFALAGASVVMLILLLPALAQPFAAAAFAAFALVGAFAWSCGKPWHLSPYISASHPPPPEDASHPTKWSVLICSRDIPAMQIFLEVMLPRAFAKIA